MIPSLLVLLLVAAFVLFVARWTPQPKPLPVPPPATNEIPIVAEDGAPLVRDGSQREAAMYEALLAAAVLARKEWDRSRPRIVLIHDDLTEEELTTHLATLGLVLPPVDAEAAPVGVRERVRDALDAEASDRIERLGTHFAPGPFDAYRLRE